MGLDMGAFNKAWQLLKEEAENFDVDNPMQVGDYATEELPHITWMSPEKRTGWVDGNLMMFGLPQWAARNKHTASVSGEEKPYTAQEHFMRQMFDAQGKLK